MAIYLVQHGTALPKEEDPQRGLSPGGIADIERIAGVAAGYGIQVSQIKHSGKKRAKQTAELFSKYLEPDRPVQAQSGLNPNDNILDTAPGIANDNTMFVGHLPFLAKLLSYLITGSQDTPVFKFQNAGIVCLDTEKTSNTWIIKWSLMPNIK